MSMIWMICFVSVGMSLYAATDSEYRSVSHAILEVLSMFVGAYNSPRSNSSSLSWMDEISRRVYLIVFVLFALSSTTAYVSYPTTFKYLLVNFHKRIITDNISSYIQYATL